MPTTYSYILTKKVRGRATTMCFGLGRKFNPVAWDVLQLLRNKTIEVPDCRRWWAPPWRQEEPPQPTAEELRGDRKRGERYLAEVERFYEGSEYRVLRYLTVRVPQHWLERVDADEIDLAIRQIPVLSWLPTACGLVHFGACLPERIAVYKRKQSPLGLAYEAAVAQDYEDIVFRTWIPPTPSPSTFQAEIQIDFTLRSNLDAFRFVLAHELGHAAANLNHVVPAITAWNGWLRNVVIIEDLLNDNYETPFGDALLDQGVEDAERKYLATLFGEIIYKWYEAYQAWWKEQNDIS